MGTVLCVMYGCVFFFKQKTAYEMRISDWSSDVCSSDLPHPLLARAEAIAAAAEMLRELDDAALDARCADVRARLMRRGLDEALVDECFALIREVTGRELGMRHFAVQLLGGLVMLDGGLAEMATGAGEGSEEPRVGEEGVSRVSARCVR